MSTPRVTWFLALLCYSAAVCVSGPVILREDHRVELPDELCNFVRPAQLCRACNECKRMTYMQNLCENPLLWIGALRDSHPPHPPPILYATLPGKLYRTTLIHGDQTIINVQVFYQRANDYSAHGPVHVQPRKKKQVKNNSIVRKALVHIEYREVARGFTCRGPTTLYVQVLCSTRAVLL